MNECNVPLTPFPCIYEGDRYSGILFDYPSCCDKCSHRQCESPSSKELLICSYGFNYQQINDDLIIFGVLAQTFQNSGKQRTKNFRNYKECIVVNAHLESLVNTFRYCENIYKNKLSDEKSRIIDKYIETEQYKVDFLKELRPEIQKGLAFVHDYKQINAQVAQNINIILETRYVGDSLDDKLQQANHAETAIYWASKFLQEKLNVAKFLLNPEWITKESEFTSFRFHGLLIKYIRIYQHMFNEKNISVSVAGNSYGHIYGNGEAVAVIPHTLLDNALKYSRENGNVNVYVNDEKDGIFLSVTSYGPRIKGNERENIFRPFFRAEAAIRQQEEGAGYGLYIAQLVAKSLGTEIRMEQEERLTERKGHKTTFSVKLPLS